MMSALGPNKLNSRDVREIKALRAAGATLQAIADRYGVTGPAIAYHVKDITPPRLRTVRRIPKTRIDPDKALRMFAFGASQADIARRFGVTQSAVASVLKRLEKEAA
jgi:DNA-binding CsgD family transcriptional regulator